MSYDFADSNFDAKEIAELRREAEQLRAWQRARLETGDAARIERDALVKALEEIIRIDQIQSQVLVDVDSAGNTYGIVPVDGACAAIARRVLAPVGTPPERGA